MPLLLTGHQRVCTPRHTCRSPPLGFVLACARGSPAPIRSKMRVMRAEGWRGTTPYYSPPTAGSGSAESLLCRLTRTRCVESTQCILILILYLSSALLNKKEKRGSRGLLLRSGLSRRPRAFFVFSALPLFHRISPPEAWTHDSAVELESGHTLSPTRAKLRQKRLNLKDGFSLQTKIRFLAHSAKYQMCPLRCEQSQICFFF